MVIHKKKANASEASECPTQIGFEITEHNGEHSADDEQPAEELPPPVSGHERLAWIAFALAFLGFLEMTYLYATKPDRPVVINEKPVENVVDKIVDKIVDPVEPPVVQKIDRTHLSARDAMKGHWRHWRCVTGGDIFAASDFYINDSKVIIPLVDYYDRKDKRPYKSESVNYSILKSDDLLGWLDICATRQIQTDGLQIPNPRNDAFEAMPVQPATSTAHKYLLFSDDRRTMIEIDHEGRAITFVTVCAFIDDKTSP